MHMYIQLVSFRRYKHSLYTWICYSELQSNPLASLLSPFLHSLLLPIRLPLLTWNPPCCDRIRPPRSQVARKLIFPFPSPCSFTPHPKIPTPRGFPDPNIHSLGRHRESGSQDPAQVSWDFWPPFFSSNWSSWDPDPWAKIILLKSYFREGI